MGSGTYDDRSARSAGLEEAAAPFQHDAGQLHRRPPTLPEPLTEVEWIDLSRLKFSRPLPDLLMGRVRIRLEDQSDAARLKFVFSADLGRHDDGGTVDIEVGAGSSGDLRFFVKGGGHRIRLGRRTRCHLMVSLGRPSALSVGDDTTMNDVRAYLDNCTIRIGRDGLFSDGIVLQGNDQHGLVDPATGAYRNSRQRRLTIGDHVWVGRRAMLLYNADVGQGSVVGAGVIARTPTPPFSYAVTAAETTRRKPVTWTRDVAVPNERERAFFRENGFPGF